MLTTPHHPKAYTHGAERAVISERQRREALRTDIRKAELPVVIRAKASANLYFAARCAVRYAEEARLTSNVVAMEKCLTDARSYRDIARTLRRDGL